MVRPKIVLFGDSITEQAIRPNGWGVPLANAYSRRADVICRGYGGYTSSWAMFLLPQLFPLCKEAEITRISAPRYKDSTEPPIATTIFFGANDAALLGRSSERQHVPIEEFKDNLRTFVLHLKECSPTMQIVIITPPPIYEEGRVAYAISAHGESASRIPERTNEVTGQYADACIEVAKEMCVWYINLWSKVQDTDGWQTKLLRDGLHLTTEGNTLVYEEVIKVLNEAGLSADSMSMDFPHHSKIDYKHPELAFQKND